MRIIINSRPEKRCLHSNIQQYDIETPLLNTTSPTRSLFSSLDDLLHQQHPLYKLSHKINWCVFEEAFTPLYYLYNGRPAKPIRLMCGLLTLKHLRNLSDKSVIAQWSENAYFQYF